MQIRNSIKDFKIPHSNYIIIDTDAGSDDAQAIILAVSLAKKTGQIILGITCVDGNASLANVITNVIITLSICQVDIPVFSGAKQALMGTSHKDNYFGEDGLGKKQKKIQEALTKEGKYRGYLLQNKPAYEFLIQSGKKYKGDLSLIAIGPLTNIAYAYHMDNSLVTNVNLLSIMGGSTSTFGLNESFTAQFNMNTDVVAAHIVVKIFPCIFMATIDFIFDHPASEYKQVFLDDRSRIGRFVHEIHQIIIAQYPPSICDPVAVIAAMCPEVIKEVYQVHGEIELKGFRSKGCLALDWFNNGKQNSKNKLNLLSKIDISSLVKSIEESYDMQ